MNCIVPVYQSQWYFIVFKKATYLFVFVFDKDGFNTIFLGVVKYSEGKRKIVGLCNLFLPLTLTERNELALSMLELSSRVCVNIWVAVYLQEM